jgi:phosphatidylglycerol:prolipoprotein diacylglycerol transferase
MIDLLSAVRHPTIDPVFLRLGPIQLRWYGLAYVMGFMLGYLALTRLVKSGRLRITADELADLISWVIGGVLLGGRLGWWTFYDYNRPAGQVVPWYEPIALWNGGMSFHGGLIGVMLAVTVWCRFRKAAIWNVADNLCLVVPIGLFFGRIANFINAELFGRPSDVPWAVIFPGETFGRHPSQLYEAILEGPLLLGFIWLVATLTRKTASDGRIFGAFLVFYGLGRFAVEFTREPDPQLGFIAFGWLTMGQILSAVMTMAGGIVWTLRARPSRLFGRP